MTLSQRCLGLMVVVFLPKCFLIPKHPVILIVFQEMRAPAQTFLLAMPAIFQTLDQSRHSIVCPATPSKSPQMAFIWKQQAAVSNNFCNPVVICLILYRQRHLAAEESLFLLSGSGDIFIIFHSGATKLGVKVLLLLSRAFKALFILKRPLRFFFLTRTSITIISGSSSFAT